MSGFSSIESDVHGAVMYADNASFDGTARGGIITNNGELWIGADAAPFVRKNTLTAGTGVSVTNGAGSITIAASSTTPLNFPTDTITATPVANSLTISGGTIAGGGISTTGSGSTVGIRLSPNYNLSDYAFQNLAAATTRTLEVNNQDNDASSSAILRCAVTGSSAADPYLQVGINSVMNYCWGIDNSDSDTLKISANSNANTATPSGGTVLYKLTSAGAGSYVAGNLDVTRSAVGSSVRATISNTDNTNTVSHANLFLSSGGSSGGNAYVVTQVSGVSGYAFGIDNADSDKFKITNSNTFVAAGTTLFSMTNGGAVSLINNLDQTATIAGTLFHNISNVSNGAGHAALQSISVGGTSAGDPFTTYTVSGTTNWSIGIDNSVSGDPFVIAASTSLGTNNAISIGTDGTTSIVAGQTVAVTAPGAYPYTTLATDFVIIVDTSAARTINLIASPATGRIYRIKDNTGSAAANNITITPAAGNIDGAANFVINTNYGSVDVVYNGTQWNLL